MLSPEQTSGGAHEWHEQPLSFPSFAWSAVNGPINKVTKFHVVHGLELQKNPGVFSLCGLRLLSRIDGSVRVRAVLPTSYIYLEMLLRMPMVFM